jgi:hypothetical protein
MQVLATISNGSITAIFPYDQGHKLACVAGGGSELVLFDPVDNKNIATTPIFPGTFFGNVRSSAASPDGAFVAVTSSDMVREAHDNSWKSAEPCKLTVFDTAVGKEQLSWEFVDYADFSFSQVVFADPRTLVVCTPSGQMFRWTLDGGGTWRPDDKPVRISPGRHTAAAASSDGKIIYLAADKEISGIDAETGKLRVWARLNVGERLEELSSFPINAIAATQEPYTLAAALWDGRVALLTCHVYDEPSTSAQADSETTAIEGEEHLPFPTRYFKAGETVEPTEKVIYYKTAFASPPYLTYDVKVPFAPQWETGYQVTNEKADSFTLKRTTPARFQVKVEANGEIMPQSGPAHEPFEALKFHWKAEGRLAK